MAHQGLPFTALKPYKTMILIVIQDWIPFIFFYDIDRLPEIFRVRWNCVFYNKVALHIAKCGLLSEYLIRLALYLSANHKHYGIDIRVYFDPI